MKASTLSVLSGLVAVRNYLDEHPVKLASVNANPVRLNLDRAIAIAEPRVQQILGAEAADDVDRDRHDDIRREVHRAARPVILIARTALGRIPELAALRSPAHNLITGALIAQVHALADTVARHRRVFEAEGLAPGTSEELRSLARRLDLSVGRRRMGQARRQKMLVEVADAIRLGRDAITVLAPLIHEYQAAIRRDTAPQT